MTTELMRTRRIDHWEQSPSQKRSTTMLRKRIERRESVRFWGRLHFITPRLSSAIFGDGMQLIYVTPLNTRPNHYVVRVDSSWTDFNSDDFRDHIDEILLDLEEEYGNADDEELWDKRRKWKPAFPAVSLEVGVCWGKLSV